MNLVTAKLTDLAVNIIEGVNFGHLATLMPDGSTQVTPVWVDHDGDFILVNTAVGRVKQRNVTRDPSRNRYHRSEESLPQSDYSGSCSRANS